MASPPLNLWIWRSSFYIIIIWILIYFEVNYVRMEYISVPLAEFVNNKNYTDSPGVLEHSRYVAHLHKDTNTYSISVGPYVLAAQESWGDEETAANLEKLLEWMKIYCSRYHRHSQYLLFKERIDIITEYLGHYKSRISLLSDQIFENHPFIKLLNSLSLDLIFSWDSKTLGSIKTLLSGNDGGIPSMSRYFLFSEELGKRVSQSIEYFKIGQFILSYLEGNNRLSIILLNLLNEKIFKTFNYEQRMLIIAFCVPLVHSNEDSGLVISLGLPLSIQTSMNSFVFYNCDSITAYKFGDTLNDYFKENQNIERILYQLPQTRSSLINCIFLKLPVDKRIEYILFFMEKYHVTELRANIVEENLTIMLGDWVIFDDLETNSFDVESFWKLVSSIPGLDKEKTLIDILSLEYPLKIDWLNIIPQEVSFQLMTNDNVGTVISKEFDFTGSYPNKQILLIAIKVRGMLIEPANFQLESYESIHIPNTIQTVKGVRALIISAKLNDGSFFKNVFLTSTDTSLIAIAMNIITDEIFASLPLEAKRAILFHPLTTLVLRQHGHENSFWHFDLVFNSPTLAGFVTLLSKGYGNLISFTEIFDLYAPFSENPLKWKAVVIQFLSSPLVSRSQRRTVFRFGNVSDSTISDYAKKKPVSIDGELIQIGDADIFYLAELEKVTFIGSGTISTLPESREHIKALWLLLSLRQHVNIIEAIIKTNQMAKLVSQLLFDLLTPEEFCNLSYDSRTKLQRDTAVTFNPSEKLVMRVTKAPDYIVETQNLAFKNTTEEELTGLVSVYPLIGIVLISPARNETDASFDFVFSNGINLRYTVEESLPKTKLFLQSFPSTVSFYWHLAKTFYSVYDVRQVLKYKDIFYPMVPYPIFELFTEEEIGIIFINLASESVVRQMEWYTFKKALNFLKTNTASPIRWESTISFVIAHGPLGIDAQEDPPNSVELELYLKDCPPPIQTNVSQLLPYLPSLTFESYSAFDIAQQWIYFNYAGKYHPSIYENTDMHHLLALAKFAAFSFKKPRINLSESLADPSGCKCIFLSKNVTSPSLRISKDKINSFIHELNVGGPSVYSEFPKDSDRRNLAIHFLEQVVEAFALSQPPDLLTSLVPDSQSLSTENSATINYSRTSDVNLSATLSISVLASSVTAILFFGFL